MVPKSFSKTGLALACHSIGAPTEWTGYGVMSCHNLGFSLKIPNSFERKISPFLHLWQNVSISFKQPSWDKMASVPGSKNGTFLLRLQPEKTKLQQWPLDFLMLNQIFWTESFSLNLRNLNLKVSNTEKGLLQPGHTTHSKDFQTPFFERYFKFLPVGSSDGFETSPKFFFWKIFKK